MGSVSHLKYELACQRPTVLWEIIFSCKKRVVKSVEKMGRGMEGKRGREGLEAREQPCLELVVIYRFLFRFF